MRFFTQWRLHCFHWERLEMTLFSRNSQKCYPKSKKKITIFMTLLEFCGMLKITTLSSILGFSREYYYIPAQTNSSWFGTLHKNSTIYTLSCLLWFNGRAAHLQCKTIPLWLWHQFINQNDRGSHDQTREVLVLLMTAVLVIQPYWIHLQLNWKPAIFYTQWNSDLWCAWNYCGFLLKTNTWQ